MVVIGNAGTVWACKKFRPVPVPKRKRGFAGKSGMAMADNCCLHFQRFHEAKTSLQLGEDLIKKTTASGHSWVKSQKEPECLVARRFLEKKEGQLTAHTSCYRDFNNSWKIERALSAKKRLVSLIHKASWNIIFTLLCA